MPLRLRMSVLSQVAIIVASWILPFGVFVLAGPLLSGALEIPALVVALLVAVTLSVRGTECGVDCTPDTIRVRGWVRTVSIPTSAVTGVDQRRNTLLWTDPGGVERRTRVHAFGRSRSGRHDPHSQESLERLADWVGSR
ncbi:hypothetical protein [Kutzneria sp. NPDC051319]|uniref:hypothetical protein n=1 Tax=Kutzneria sp. NPDC051319 TaxID=3155047 RepID=UPI00343507D4